MMLDDTGWTGENRIDTGFFCPQAREINSLESI